VISNYRIGNVTQFLLRWENRTTDVNIKEWDVRIDLVRASDQNYMKSKGANMNPVLRENFERITHNMGNDYQDGKGPT
jgi:hypothetical protein